MGTHLAADLVHRERRHLLELKALAGAHVFLGHADHELNAVELVDLGRTGVVVHRDNVALGVLTAQFLDHSLTHHVVGQARKGLRADDVGRTVVDQVEHLSREQPAFTHVIAHRKHRAGLVRHGADPLGRLEAAGLLEHLLHRRTHPVHELDERLHARARSGRASQLVLLQLGVAHGVQEEVEQARYHGLAALALDDIDHVVVGRGMELDQDLTDHAHARLSTLAHKRHGVERADGLAAQLGVVVTVKLGRQLAGARHVLLVERVGGTGRGLVRATAVEHLHHDVTKEHRVDCLLKQAVYAVLFGDVMMQMLYRCRPYEATPGAANALYEEYMARARKLAPKFNRHNYTKLCREAIRAFDTMPLVGEGTKPRVGVVGEILVKFHPTANNHVVDVIEREGCEAVVPGLLDFFLYSMSNAELQKDELGSSATTRAGMQALIKLVDWMRTPVEEMLEKSRRFEAPERIGTMADKARTVLSVCNNMGEGWLLTAEMLDLIDHGAPNIICTQPFACLPNHVVGKAVIKELRRQHPESNIVAVDYDPGASEVNQLNRIKLMISVAKENMRAGKGFKLEKVAPLAMDEVSGQMRAHDGCVSCGSVDESAVASVAERLGCGVK